MTKKINSIGQFVPEIVTILGRSELRSGLKHMGQEVWKSFGRISNDSFVIKKNASYYYFRCLDYVREQLIKKDIKVSEDYLETEFCNFLESLKRNNGEILDESKTWLDKLCTLKSKQFKLLIPISHYDYRNEITFPSIKIVKLTDEILGKNFNVEGELSKMFSASKLSEDNKTTIFAIVNVESSEQKHAEEIAYEVVEKFIYATKLIDPGSFVRLRKCSMVQINEEILVEEKGKPLSFHLPSRNIPARINPGDDFYNKFQPYWDKLSNFLYISNPNDLQSVILSALYWFGEADVHIDSRIKLFLYYVSGMERVVLHDSEDIRQKGVPFGKRCAKIFYGDEKEWEFWKEYYWKRNNIIHEKFEYIYKEEIDTLRIELRSLLLQLIEFTDTYSTVEEVFKSEFGISET